MREQLIRMIEYFKNYEELLNINRDMTIEVMGGEEIFNHVSYIRLHLALVFMETELLADLLKGVYGNDTEGYN